MVWAYEQNVPHSGEKFTLVTAAQYCNDSGVCWVKQETLAEDMSMGASTVRRHLDKLEESGLILRAERRRRDGTRSSDLIKLVGFNRSNRADDDEPTTAQIEQINRSNRAGNNRSKRQSETSPVTSSNEDVEPEARTAVGERTPQQELMDRFYYGLKDRYNIRLTRERYSFHLGKFRDMLQVDNATEDEQNRVLVHMENVYPKAPKINAVDALADVRLGRDTGEAWEGPAPWEEADRKREAVNPQSDAAQEMRDQPRKPEWYATFYEITVAEADDLLITNDTHTAMIEAIERFKRDG